MITPSQLFNETKEVIDVVEESIEDKQVLEEEITHSVSLIDGAFRNIQEQILSSNKKELSAYKDQVLEVYNLCNDIKENQLPKYKKEVLQSDLRTESRIRELKVELYETLEERLEETKETIKVFFREEVKDLNKLRSSVIAVEEYIKKTPNTIFELREQVFKELRKSADANEELIKEKLDKIGYEYEVLQEGLLNEPPSTNNSDTLTPLDKNFVTFDQLQQHYKVFVNRVQQQMATVGGGGEVLLQYLDDVDRSTALINGRVLQYDAVAGIWTGGVGGNTLNSLSELTNDVGFVTSKVVGDFEITGNISIGGTLTKEDVKNIDSVGLITARSGIVATGVVTATSFVGDGTSLAGIVTVGSATTSELLIHDGTSVTGISSVAYSNFVTDCSQGYYAYTTDAYSVGVANTVQELPEDVWSLLQPQVAATYNHQTHQMTAGNNGNPYVGSGATIGTGQTEFSLAGMSAGANCLVRIAFDWTPDVDDSDLDIRLFFTTNTSTQGTGLTNFSIDKQALLVTQGAAEVYPGEILIPFFVGATLTGISTSDAGSFHIEAKPSDEGELEMKAVTVSVDN
tara:strand:+ start:1032 stop:2744 length:1713 start_codon:yes stop_codon:yes gene_type:complete